MSSSAAARLHAASPAAHSLALAGTQPVSCYARRRLRGHPHLPTQSVNSARIEMSELPSLIIRTAHRAPPTMARAQVCAKAHTGHRHRAPAWRLVAHQLHPSNSARVEARLGSLARGLHKRLSASDQETQRPPRGAGGRALWGSARASVVALQTPRQTDPSRISTCRARSRICVDKD
jgi:hypothetical protein